MIRLLKDINSGKNKAGEKMSLPAEIEESLVKDGWAEVVEKPVKEVQKKETPKKKEGK